MSEKEKIPEYLVQKAMEQYKGFSGEKVGEFETIKNIKVDEETIAAVSRSQHSISIVLLKEQIKMLEAKVLHFYTILRNLDDVDYLKEEYEQLFHPIIDKDGA